MPAHITCLMASWPTREKPAVLTAYGCSAKKDLLTQLLELILAIAQRLEKKELVTPPGISAAFPKPETVVTDVCVRFPALVQPYLCGRGERQGTAETR